jgi:hypothetical protein
VCADLIIHDDGVADEVRKSAAHAKRKALLKLGRKPVHETVLLLLISVNLLWSILCQMVEELSILMHEPSTLLEVHEFLMLPSHDTCGNVKGVEGLAILTPWHLIVHRASGSVIGPPHARISPHLLCGEEGLLSLSAGARTWTQSREASCRPPEALLPQ